MEKELKETKSKLEATWRRRGEAKAADESDVEAMKKIEAEALEKRLEVARRRLNAKAQMEEMRAGRRRARMPKRSSAEVQDMDVLKQMIRG